MYPWQLLNGRAAAEQFRALLYVQVRGFPTMLYVADHLHAYMGTRDINHLKNFARRDWEHVVEGAKSSIPPQTESLPAWQRYLVDPAADHFADILASYEGIWVSRSRFAGAPSTSSREIIGVIPHRLYPLEASFRNPTCKIVNLRVHPK